MYEFTCAACGDDLKVLGAKTMLDVVKTAEAGGWKVISDTQALCDDCLGRRDDGDHETVG